MVGKHMLALQIYYYHLINIEDYSPYYTATAMCFLSGNSTESSIGLLLIAKAIQACRLMWHGVFGLCQIYH